MAAVAHRWGLNDSMMAGAGAGLVSSIATCPLDVIKTKLQAQKTSRGSQGYLGVFDMVKDILRRSGIRGLYRGLGPTVLGYLPTWAIYFAIYDGAKSFLSTHDHTPEPSSAPSSPATDGKSKPRIYPAPQPKGYSHHGQDHPWRIHIISAMIAGMSSTIATNPLWVVKTRFMTQSVQDQQYRHTVDAIRTIYSQEGPRAFYRGLLPSLMGIAHVAVQFPMYEQLKTWAKPADDSPLSTPRILLCSGASKMVASIATYPHEVVRTQLQIQKRHLAHTDSVPTAAVPPKHPGVVGVIREVVHVEGWRGLYKGLSVNLLRTVPNSAVTMLTYELLMRYLHEHH